MAPGQRPAVRRRPAAVVGGVEDVARASRARCARDRIRYRPAGQDVRGGGMGGGARRSEEHTSELQSLMRISYAVFCLKKKKNKTTNRTTTIQHTNRQLTHRIKQNTRYRYRRTLE